MDPVATLAIVVDDTADLTDRIDACGNLLTWIDDGGFLPPIPEVWADVVTDPAHIRQHVLILGRHLLYMRGSAR